MINLLDDEPQRFGETLGARLWGLELGCPRCEAPLNLRDVNNEEWLIGAGPPRDRLYFRRADAVEYWDGES